MNASLHYWNFSWIAEDVLGFPMDDVLSAGTSPLLKSPLRLLFVEKKRSLQAVT